MDLELLYLINREWTHPGADVFMATVSSFDIFVPFLIAGGVAVLIWGGFRGRSFLFCTAMVFLVNDGLVTQFVKEWVKRPRPAEALVGVRMLDIERASPRFMAFFGGEDPVTEKISGITYTPVGGRSYPSGHVANNFALAVILAVFFRRWGWIYFVPAAVVAYSRVYVGSHWPSDLVGSMFQGVGVALIVLVALEWAWRRFAGLWWPGLVREHPSLLLPPGTGPEFGTSGEPPAALNPQP